MDAQEFLAGPLPKTRLETRITRTSGSLEATIFYAPTGGREGARGSIGGQHLTSDLHFAAEIVLELAYWKLLSE